MEVKLNDVLSAHLQDYNANRVSSTSSTGTTPRVNPTIPIKKAPATKTCTQGRITGMLPENVVSAAEQDMNVIAISQALVENRLKVWRDKDGKILAFIAHYESVWYSFWFPPAADKGKYLYGCALAFKDNATTLNKVEADRYPLWQSLPRTRNRTGDWRIDGLTTDQLQPLTCGRTKFLRKHILVTRELLRQGFNPPAWIQPHQCNSTHSKGWKFRQLGTEIREQIKETNQLPIWRDVNVSTNPLERLVGNNNSIWYCISDKYIAATNTPHRYALKREKVPFKIYEHSLQWWLEYLPLCQFSHIDKSFYTKPAVRKIIQQALDQSQAAMDLSNTDNNEYWYRDRVAAPMTRMYYWFVWCNYIFGIWHDCPQDHLVNNYDLLQQLRVDTMTSNTSIKQWLGKHMPIASFFQIATKGLEKAIQDKENNRYDWTDDSIRQVICYKMRMLNDTLNSLNDLITAGRDPQKPSRWRIAEWHDEVVAESWKIRNADFPLPQDMFPSPVKVTVESKNFCFIQPCSAHQLAQWGSAARNCVGSTHYSNSIKAKKHFILMIMLENKPRFTARLKLESATLKVAEIKDIGNRRISDEEQGHIQQALSIALTRRSTELLDETIDEVLAES